MAAVQKMGKNTADGVGRFFESKIEMLEAKLRDKTENLRRLQAQRNELNTHVRL